MKSPKISVFILTYNSNPKKLEFTLKTLLRQNYPDLEIVISDDASSEIEHYNIINKYRNLFPNYEFITHKKNVGIVKNIYESMKLCSGELIVGLSPGDGLYSFDTLANLMDYYIKNPCLFFITYLRSYRINNLGYFEDVDFMAPTPKHRPILGSPNKTFNRLMKRNFISGVTIIRSKQLLNIKELRLPPETKFLEDHTFLTQATYLGYKVNIFEKYAFWYEYGEGISTKRDINWSNRLNDDRILCLKWLIKNGTDNWKNQIIAKKLNQLGFFLKHKNKVFKGIYAMLFQPNLIYDRFFPKDELHSPEIARFREELVKIQGNGFLEILKSTLEDPAKEKKVGMEEG